jgi:membrane protease subunit HflK
MRRAAEAYEQQRVLRAEGEADRFSAVLKEYKEAPGVTRDRLYLETMETVLPRADKFIFSTGSGSNVLPLLPLAATEGDGTAGTPFTTQRRIGQ